MLSLSADRTPPPERGSSTPVRLALASWLLLCGCPAESPDSSQMPETDPADAAGRTVGGDLETGPESGEPDADDASAPTTQTARLFGTPAGETLFDVAYGSETDDIYVAGTVTENFQGQRNAGAVDVFVARLRSDLSIRWIELVGSPSIDEHPALAVHEPSDRVYVSGETRGAVGKGTHRGSVDVFTAAFDLEGTRRWAETFGSPKRDRLPRLGRTIVANEAGVFIPLTVWGEFDGRPTRGQSDALVLHLDRSGRQLWKRFIPRTRKPYFSGRQTSSGLALREKKDRLLWVGYSIANDRSDVLVATLHLSGDHLQTRRHPAEPLANPAAIVPRPASGSYAVAGTLTSPDDPTNRDAFVWNIEEGRVTWRRRFEGPGEQFVTDLRLAEDRDQLLLSGTFDRSIRGIETRGARDIFVARLDSAGTVRNLTRFGTPSLDWAKRLAPSRNGRPALLCGVTGGSLFGLRERGDLDGFVTAIRE